MCRQRSSKTPERPEQALKEHRHIVEAISMRDAELAELLMRRHISGAWKIVNQLLNDEHANEEQLQFKGKKP
jgi:DNA-binding FadR family transcriptional regulator